MEDYMRRYSVNRKFNEGDLVVLREDIDYTFEGRDDVHLPRDLEGKIKNFHADGHALVSFRFPDRLEDHYVLTDDFDKLAPCYDTDQHPYADHGTQPQQAAEELPPGPVEPAKRLSNPPQFLPIIFVNFTIAFLYIVYVLFHCLPMMQIDEKPEMVDKDARKRGLISFVAITIVTLLLIIAYLRAILTHPGGIPDGDPLWQYHHDEEARKKNEPVLQEKKKDNTRRHCKHCWKYKPDRCHHCKVCGMCILKMDHHCPWIYNCVGFHNYKFFFLLLMYAVICTHIIVWTMSESVTRSIEEEAPFMTIFFTLFGVTLAASLSLILTLFWMFHVWLVFKGLSTIEFCEKQAKDESDSKDNATFCEILCGDVYTSRFDHGACANMKAVLGDWILLWFLPCNTPSGDGFSFPDPREPIWERAIDRAIETKRGLYTRSSHKKRVRHKPRESFV